MKNLPVYVPDTVETVEIIVLNPDGSIKRIIKVSTEDGAKR